MESETSETEPDAPSEEMDLLEHLGELRVRLIRSALAIVIGGIASYAFSRQTFSFLMHPFFEAFSDTQYQLIGTGPAEAFLLKIKVALFLGVIISSPVIFGQIWGFISPGLYEHERKLFLPFVGGSTFLFLSGVLFCHVLVLPIAFDFFRSQYSSLPGLAPYIKVGEYFSMVVKSIIGFGIVFELPMLAYFLARVGIITVDLMLNYARHATVVIFILSAILTPPDVFSQFLMAGGLMMLYGVSILVVKIAERGRG